MSILTIENLSKSHGEKLLFNNISFSISEGEKIGLIGVNGTGKSTLLEVLSGYEDSDEGKILKGNGVRIEYLPQNVDFEDNATVLEQVFKGNSPVMVLLRQYEEALKNLEEKPQEERLQKKLMELSSKMDGLDAWEIEGKAKIVLTRLGIHNFNDKVKNLSGGEKKRVALAGVLISPCELLILDEPTNHIDNDTVRWLENFLNERKGALVMITHDRYFLDRVTNRILELSNGKLYSYEGNYSVFLNAKVEREQIIQSQEQKRQNLYKRELEWIRKGAKARTTKQKARIDRFEEIKSQKVEIKNEKIDISIEGSRLGKKILQLEDVSKSYGDKKLIENFSYIFTREDKVGVIGPNGAGKSTLLNMILGNTVQDKGEISIGETVQVGYFSQEYEDMNENLRVIEYVREGAEFIKLSDGTVVSASKMLERFLFSSNLQYSYISKLSGGEKRRLYLLRVLMSAPNVLVLDEPTNDLDVETLSVLEEYINSFNGTVITVSHDRYFLDKVCNKLLVFKGNGIVEAFVGNYSEYEEQLTLEDKKISDDSSKKNKIKNNEDIVEKSNKTLKFSYKEKREYEQIESIIEDVEMELDEVNKNISLCGSDYIKLQEFLDKKSQLEAKLEELMNRWEYLSNLADKIDNQS